MTRLKARLEVNMHVCMRSESTHTVCTCVVPLHMLTVPLLRQPC
jgi:hypothetical protein